MTTITLIGQQRYGNACCSMLELLQRHHLHDGHHRRIQQLQEVTGALPYVCVLWRSVADRAVDRSS